VRTIFESPELVSLGISYTPVAKGEIKDDASGDEGKKLRSRLTVRMRDRIAIINPAKDERREFVVPESLLHESLLGWLRPNDQLLLNWNPRSEGARINRLMWVESDGKIAREESPRLASYSGPFSERTEATIMAAGAPVPLGWYAIVGAI